MKVLFAIVFSLATTISGYSSHAFSETLPQSKHAQAVEVGDTLPAMLMNGLTGADSNLSAYRGKPLLINVWASYCPPCMAEMASLENLHQRFGDQVNFIGISIDDYRDRAEGFLQKAKSSFPHYIDQKLQLETLLGAQSIPLTVLVDGEGKVLFKIHGARDWDKPSIVSAVAGTFQLPVPAELP